jgi:hypothetical protein
MIVRELTVCDNVRLSAAQFRVAAGQVQPETRCTRDTSIC